MGELRAKIEAGRDCSGANRKLLHTSVQLRDDRERFPFESFSPEPIRINLSGRGGTFLLWQQDLSVAVTTFRALIEIQLIPLSVVPDRPLRDASRLTCTIAATESREPKHKGTKHRADHHVDVHTECLSDQILCPSSGQVRSQRRVISCGFGTGNW